VTGVLFFLILAAMLAFAAREVAGIFRGGPSGPNELELHVDGRVGAWKRCAWPQCSAPMPASSRRAFCSDECRSEAHRCRLQARARDYGDEPPF
jgi:hypothetical protein